MRKYSLILLLPLVACASPREKCELDATEDLSIVKALIAETEQNLSRGYAIERTVETRPNLTFCFADKFNTGNAVFTYCNEFETAEVKTPVAINVTAEKAKLADLKRKESELRSRTKDALAQCAVAFPST
ncbi:hypothetical protein ACMU_13990 [Actibacterium mucosum KCTC 23349]|uniref:Uncharacterized protein n=1 Tax=Actibacterium mucosum KCTC 23349 TaxID=1454373 RepID=A0A037ZEG7_9RHOB|nr:hypothetical protein [Actibacterium mucosum]KAJ54870.1 hypothetical protein ACMU_13990 [Actibacterium mucosum KCTC 23349]